MRKVRTASGATAVQVVEKRHGKLRLIEHVGSAHTEAELGLLLERAHQVLRGGQEVVELGIEDPVRQEPLVPASASLLSLFDTAVEETSTPVAVDRPRTVGAVSDVLWSAYARLGFDALGDEVFEQLVLARLVEPTSKLDSIRVLTELGVKAPHRNTLGACLKRVNAAGYRDQIAAKCFEHAVARGDISLVLYDVTTLLCRCRHKSVYADLLIMPMFGVSVQVRH